MSPRPGGEADKLGNRYELAWAIRHALYCLADGGNTLTLEDVDVEIGKGSEFTFTVGSATEVHQLKRQNGNSNSWSVKALADLKVFECAAGHVTAGRAFHFVSLVPCRPLQELSDRARKSADLAAFTRTWLTDGLRPHFDQLAADAVLGDPQRAWDTLRGMWFSVQDEGDIVRMNAMLAGRQLGGASGEFIALAIGDILHENLGRRLARVELLELLSAKKICPLTADFRQSASEQLRAVTASWRDSVRRELLVPRIERTESTDTIEALNDRRVVLVGGTAGGGKSAVLEHSVEALEASGAKVLALRLDRLEPFTSTPDLGRQLGLETSPAVVLALAADGRDAYLVIDQLDAVSLASGRMPESFDVVMDLIREALSVSGLKVILACREFDIDNDHRIRSLTDRLDTVKVSVGLLTAEAVSAAVTAMSLDSARLTASQRSILQTPMHLVLLSSIASQDTALAFQSRGSLFDAYWERKRQMARRKRTSVRFNAVLSRIANAASDRQTLSVPIEILDEDELVEDANVLVSEHVLARDGDRISFFHEAFFDYAFARQWVLRSESLTDFLLRDEQELFRRGQVRQILQHLYEREPDRFRAEAVEVLTSDHVRFHIMETVLEVLSNLDAPNNDDAEVIFEVSASAPTHEDQLWLRTRRAPWFKRFYEDGAIATWLDSNDSALEQRAVNFMMSAAREFPDEVAELLRTRQLMPEYLNWLRSLARFSGSFLSRKLFDLIIVAIRKGAFDEGEHELWWAVHDLAKRQPLWAIELIEARVIEHADALRLDEEGKVASLKLREYGASQLVRQAAAAEPLAFVQAIVPYLRRVMAATAYGSRLEVPICDRHFCTRFKVDELDDKDLDDALFSGAVSALESLAQTAPENIRGLLEGLVEDPHEAAQFLLYRAMTAGGSAFANWAASLLLEGGSRLHGGYISDSEWAARELVKSIAPYLPDDIHSQLEELFRDLRNAGEIGHSFGWSALTFLSALEESRLTTAGVRRLGEYRRKFQEDVPAQPQGIVSGVIGSPIEADAARKMSDDQWITAMAKHNADRTNWKDFTGGARELSHVLHEQAKADSVRFALLALKLTDEFNSAFASGLLMGFADAERADDAGPLICDAVRHLASLGHNDVDRWLGSALRRYYAEVPIDLVELLLDRALRSPDPADDSPIFKRDGEDGRSAADMRNNAINTGRGSLVEVIGDLLIYDADGERTDLVRPHLTTLASDPVLFVRSNVAHTLAASLRHARPDAIAAFRELIDTDDRILAARMVQHLMLYIGNVEPDVITPVIQRMLESSDHEAREAGGALSAFAGLEWGLPDLLTRALEGDAKTRKGVAAMCANRVDRTSNAVLASSTLTRLMTDRDEDVLKAVAEVAPHLRDHRLRPFANLLAALIDSPAYDHATPQLLLTLQHAPDRVDDLALQASQRFISVFGREAGDLRTGAAGNAHYISELVVRGLAQSRDKRHRAALLDVLDKLLELCVYGIDDAIAEAERL